MTEQLAAIEAVADMGKRRSRLQSCVDTALAPISAFVQGHDETELVSLAASGTMIITAPRQIWRDMLNAEDSPLRSETISLFPNETVTLDGTSVQSPIENPTD